MRPILSTVRHTPHVLFLQRSHLGGTAMGRSVFDADGNRNGQVCQDGDDQVLVRRQPKVRRATNISVARLTRPRHFRPAPSSGLPLPHWAAPCTYPIKPRERYPQCIYQPTAIRRLKSVGFVKWAYFGSHSRDLVGEKGSASGSAYHLLHQQDQAADGGARPYRSDNWIIGCGDDGR